MNRGIRASGSHGTDISYVNPVQGNPRASDTVEGRRIVNGEMILNVFRWYAGRKRLRSTVIQDHKTRDLIRLTEICLSIVFCSKQGLLEKPGLRRPILHAYNFLKL